METRQLDLEQITSATEVIRQSYSTVAGEFGLTPANSPTHPAFLTEEQLGAHMADGLWGIIGDRHQLLGDKRKVIVYLTDERVICHPSSLYSNMRIIGDRGDVEKRRTLPPTKQLTIPKRQLRITASHRPFSTTAGTISGSTEFAGNLLQ